jgi:ABC-2 type transport system permease protein
MIAALRAEWRKIFSLRSTYLIMLLTFAVLMLFAFYVEGIRGAESANDPFKLGGLIINAVNTTAIFSSIVGVLLITHEYRYNTIMHTLTLSRSRLHVLLAKVIVISMFAILFTVVATAVAMLLTRIGLSIANVHLVPQTIYYGDLLWRAVFYGWAHAMFGLIIALIIRNQVGSIVAFFIIPSTVEALLGLLLKSKAIYLPFNLLGAVISNVNAVGPLSSPVTLTHAKAAWLIVAYLAIAGLITTVLFVRRDAN